MRGKVAGFSMKWKLILSFAAIALLFAATAVYQRENTNRVERSMETQKAEMEKRIAVAKITQSLQAMNSLETSLAKWSDLEAVDQFAEKQDRFFSEMASLSFEEGSDASMKLAQLQTKAREYTGYFDEIVETMNDEEADPLEVLETIDRLHTQSTDANEALLALNEQLYAAAAENAEKAQGRSFELLNNTMSISTYAALFVFVFTIVVAILLLRSFLKPVQRLQSALRTIAEGDLRHRIRSSSNDELGRLSHHFDHMVDKVRDMLQQTRSVASSLAAYSRSFEESSSITANANQDIVKTIQDISEGAEEQAGQTENSANLIQELHREILDIAAYAEAMLTTSEEANRNASQGSAAVTELRKTSEFSRASVGKAYDALSRLTELSNKISVITNSITEVSNQTNILALNAAIEAARAGSNGKGFGVIADEVRKLSEQTKESSVHIGAMIDELRAGMENFRKQMLETSTSLETQDRQVSETLLSFTSIDRSIQEIGRQIGHIHRKADTTQAKNATLAESIRNVAAIAEETAAGVQEVNASSQQQDKAIRDIARQAVDINELSQRLYREISVFKISDETDDEAAFIESEKAELSAEESEKAA